MMDWLFPDPADGLCPIALAALLLPLVLAGLDPQWHSARVRKAFRATCILALIGAISYTAYTVVDSVENPPEFDFMANWIPARVAAHGLDFYDPANYRTVTERFDPDFKLEILKVGFWYPPPAMLLVRPFGSLEVHRAVLLWYLLQLAALTASILLLWRTLLPRSGIDGLGGVAAMFFLFRPTYSTIDFAQNNFITLLCLVAFWKDRDRTRAGIWLALAAVTKPVALAPAVYLVIRRRWRALVTLIATLGVLMLAACAAFGVGTVATYFRSNPVSRMPTYLYSQHVNQSLSAELLRMKGLDTTPFAKPMRTEWIIAAAAFMAFTAWAAFRRGWDERLLFTLTLVAALILYPASLEHYSVLLILPFLLIVSRFESAPGERIAWTALLVAAYALAGAMYGGVFWAYGMIWVALLITAARTARPRAAIA